MRFKPSLGRWLWFYPAAAGVNLILMYNMSGTYGPLHTVANLAGVVLIIAGILVFYPLLFTRYELGENELVIKQGLSEPLRIPYRNIHSVNVRLVKDSWDIPGTVRSLMSLDAIEVLYSGGRKTRSVILITPKDKDAFRRELEGRLETDGQNASKVYQYEV